MDEGLFKAIFATGSVIVIAIAGYFNNRLNKVDAKAEDGSKALLEHKLHVSENYAKHSTLADLRVEQLDSTKRIWEGINNIQADIKILIKGNHK